MTKTGRFITFEGPDGAGKTTQIELLRKKFEKDESWLFTRNPGGTELGKKFRQLLLDEKNSNISAKTELLLYMADRAQHIDEVIKPAMKAGKTVVCDRFSDSTLAYQGFGRGLDIKLIKALNDICTDGFKPDLTFLFDISPEEGLSRAQDKNRFEAEGLELQRKVRAGFLQLASEEPERFRIINVVGLSAEEIHKKICNEL